MPREFPKDTERDEEPEIDENNENPEVNETERDAERIAKEVSEELEEQERIKEITEDAVKKLREADEAAERAKENERKTTEERDGFEEDLGNKLEDAREKLQEDFVNDMKERLDEGSQKETSSESEESPEGGESEDKTESSKTYIEGSDGMVYELKTGGASESSTELEVEESSEPAKEETSEARETEGQEENAEQDVREKVRNSIRKQEMSETPETEGSSEEESKEHKEEPADEESSTPESESYEPKRDQAVEEDVEESKETEESARIEIKEEEREVTEEKTESESVIPQEVSNPETFPETEEPTKEEVPESSVEHEEVVPEQEKFIEEEEVESEWIEDEVELPGNISEEIEQHIDELVDELVDELIEDIEDQEEEEPYKPRVFIDAMTGKEHVDRSLEYRPYFQETEVETEQEEQEQLDEKIDEMFDKLSEDEQESIKEAVRSKLKTEEDLDEWIKRDTSVKASPDYKEKYAEAKKYLRGKRKGPVPKLIKELWKDEVKRVWVSIVMNKVVASLAQKLSPKEKTKKSQRRTGYHRGRNRAIKLHQPMIGKSRVASFVRFEKWLQKNYPGLCERSDYPELIEKIRKFFELRKALKGLKEIKQHELDDIAKSIGLNPGTTYDWVHRDKVPHLFKIIDSALSAKDGLRLRKVLLKKMGGLSSWAELEDELKAAYSGGAYKRIPDYTGKEARTKEFFAFLRELVKGGTKKGIARRSGISQRRVRAFFDGELPWLIRNVLSKSGKLVSSSRYRSHLSSIYKVKLRALKVRKQEIVSYSEFEKLIQREFPWLKERTDYKRLMKTMRAYFDAILKFKEQIHVTRKEIVDFVKNYDVSYQTVTEWLVGTSLPMVVDMLDRALSVSEAKQELEKILKLLNGVTSLAEYKKRMRTCYIHDLLKGLSSYKKDYAQVLEFFRFLKALEKGGLYTDIIGRGKLKMGNAVQRRLYNRFPRLIGIAVSVPATPPTRGLRWIPLIMKKYSKPSQFIQVPITINKVSDLLDVLKKLIPLKTRRMKSRTKRFGSISQDIAFMYLLGALVSDGSFDRRNGTSTSVSINLSAKYPWSETFGEAFCYCLGIFGFKAGRISNSIRLNQAGEEIEIMGWKGSASPFMMWIRNTLLGLKLDRSKSNQPLNADWILKIPQELIVSFLQGVADGDGYATVRSLTAGIGSKHNKTFLRRVLDIFGIHTHDGGTGINISRKKSLQIAARLPMFKYADGRLFRLRETVVMLSSVKYSKVSTEERKRILEYYKQGVKINQIGSLLWVDFGKLRRSSAVKKVIKDAGL